MPVATEGGTDSKLPAAALSAQQLQGVLEFLDAAPEEVAVWAGGQAAALRAELAGRTDAVGEIPADPTSHPREGGDLDDESDDFYAGLENDDDVLRRKPRAVGTPKAGAAPVAGSGRVFTLRFALVVALLTGIMGGIWYAARPTATATATPPVDTPTLGTGTASAAPTEAEVLARIAELEATVAADGSNVDARLELGVLYFNQRRSDAAGEQWLAVTELAPDNATAWYNLGFLHLTIEPADLAAAKTAWQRVIDIDPESDLAKTVGMHLAGLTDPAAPDASAPSPTPSEER